MKLEKMVTRLDVKKTDDKGAVEGYGSIFGNEDTYGDIVAPGAFAQSLGSGRKVRFLWQHRADQPIGVWDELGEDERGLRVKGRLATDTGIGRDALAFLRMGAIEGLSIGYRTVKSEFDEDTGIRTITQAELWEVSLVTFPANDLANVDAVKSTEEIDALDIKGIERLMREAWGRPRGEARSVLHRVLQLGREREAIAQAETQQKAAAQRLLAALRKD